MNFTFETVDVKEELTQILKAELPKQGFPNVKVIKSDPQSPSEFPCVGINRISDDETSQSISDQLGVAYDPNTKTYTEFKGTFFSEAVEVRVWHTNADQRDLIYRTVKGILFAYRQVLVEKGLLNVTLRGGRDEQDSTMAYAPVVIYWGTITMSYLNPLNVDIIDTVDTITAITDNGSLSGVNP